MFSNDYVIYLKKYRYFCTAKDYNTMVKIRRYSTVEEFHTAIKAAIARKELLCSMLRAGASKEELEAAGIRLAPMTK